MKRIQFTVSAILANLMVFSSLGLSLFIGVVVAKADDQEGASVVRKTIAPRVETQNAIGSIINVGSNSSVRAAADAAPQTAGVRLSKNGLLTGRLNLADTVTGSRVPAENLTIKFVQHGSVVTEIKPGPGGVFQVTGLTPGAFSMYAIGADGFYATTAVIQPTALEGEAAASVSGALQIDATVVHPSNVKMVRMIINQAAKSRSGTTTGKHSVYSASRSDSDANPTPVPIQTPVLALGADGQVRSRINNVDPITTDRSPAVGAVVYFLQKGAVRGQAQVDQTGTFVVDGLAAGQYSLVVVSKSARPGATAASQSMFAALGVVVEAQGSSNNAGTASNSSRLTVQMVKKSQDPAPPAGIDLMPTNDFTQNEGPIPNDGSQPPPTPAPAPPAPAAGGFGGGGPGGGGFGGGGGGFGGIGGLAALGAIGALAAVAASNNNNNNNTPASPSSP